METIIFTLFGSVIAFYIAIIILVIVFIIAEQAHSAGTALAAFLVFIALNYFWGTAPILEIFSLLNIVIYVGAGFIFALVRTYFKGKEIESEYKHHFNLKSAVFRWWSLWPISAINWLFSRLLKDAYNWIYSKCSKLFEHLFGMPEEDQKL